MKYLFILLLLTGCASSNIPVCRHVAPMVCDTYKDYYPNSEVRLVRGYTALGTHVRCEVHEENEWIPITVSVSSIYPERGGEFIPFEIYYDTQTYRERHGGFK